MKSFIRTSNFLRVANSSYSPPVHGSDGAGHVLPHGLCSPIGEIENVDGRVLFVFVGAAASIENVGERRGKRERVHDGIALPDGRHGVVGLSLLPWSRVSLISSNTKKRMVLVRLIEQNAQDPARPLEAQVGQYEKAGKGWLEHSVKILLGGTVTTIQEYSSVAVDVQVEPELFEPLPYHLPLWVRGGKDSCSRVSQPAVARRALN